MPIIDHTECHAEQLQSIGFLFEGNFVRGEMVGPGARKNNFLSVFQFSSTFLMNFVMEFTATI